MSMRAHEDPGQVAVVGGGAGGVELTLAIAHRLSSEAAREDRPSAHPPVITLYSRSHILPSHPAKARTVALREAAAVGVVVREHAAIDSVQKGQLMLVDGSSAEFDECLWCTQASPAAWVAKTGLPTDSQGFLSIGEDLRCIGFSEVFAVGDVATFLADPRPKAGVFAVRQGPVLADNLRRLLTDQPLQTHRPQKTWLGLISTGRRHAIASKGWLCFEADWLWALKDWIDHKWMAMYGAPKLSSMAMPATSAAGREAEGRAVAAAAGAAAEATLAASTMRCSGCASKVGSTMLWRVLRRLQRWTGGAPPVVQGLDAPDDAAIIAPPPDGHVSVQTVDFFRSSVSDPFLFGRIAAEHSLGDCYAMGAAPCTALAIAVVPFGAAPQMEEELFQMMAGAASVLGAAGCALVGGHSGEGPQAALGFTITGTARPANLLRKGGLRPGQALILTKALGTAAIFAAHMRLKAKGTWVQGAVASMQQSSGAAAECLRSHGCTAATDVTGFGLLGHLDEMCRASQVSATVRADSVPALPGVAEVLAAGITSSLHPANLAAADGAVLHIHRAQTHPQWHLLLDPQTGGGLLAGVPAGEAGECLQELRALGYASAAIIGSTATGPFGITLV